MLTFYHLEIVVTRRFVNVINAINMGHLSITVHVSVSVFCVKV